MSLLINWLESMHADVKITNKCSRMRHLRSTCTVCSDVCKYEAITFTQKTIGINLERCTSCGDCMIACPLSAIAGVANAREFDKNNLIYNNGYTPSIKELLVYKARGLHAIKVEDSALNEKWEMVLDEANLKLSLLSMQPIEVILDHKEKAFSRRVFLASFQKEGKQLAKNIAPASWKMEDDEWNLSRFFPENQFFSVNINKEKCTICQTCFTFCSQNVFTLAEGFIQIDNEKCINCCDCTDICAENAIEIRPNIKKKNKNFYKYHTKTCRSCEKLFYTFNSDTERCPICKNRHPEWLSPYE